MRVTRVTRVTPTCEGPATGANGGFRGSGSGHRDCPRLILGSHRLCSWLLCWLLCWLSRWRLRSCLHSLLHWPSLGRPEQRLKSCQCGVDAWVNSQPSEGDRCLPNSLLCTLDLALLLLLLLGLAGLLFRFLRESSKFFGQVCVDLLKEMEVRLGCLDGFLSCTQKFLCLFHCMPL